MNRQALDAIETNLGHVLKREKTVTWPDDLLVIGEDESGESPVAAAIEEDLFDGLDADTDEKTVPQDLLSLMRNPGDLPGVESPLAKQGSEGTALDEVNRVLREHWGEGYPGAPGSSGGSAMLGAGAGGSATVAPPDDYAFYLPWHYFSQSMWGIYLIVEGIESLGAEIRQACGGALSHPEARRVAKRFLFHHEAYHNAVETFAGRLEVSHRDPCYIAGFQSIWTSGFGNGLLHEEGLATAYAAEKVRTGAFEDVYPPSKVRASKRKAAYEALQKIIGGMPTAYRSARLLADAQKYRDAQNLFQEGNANNCFPPLRTLPPDIWEAFPHAMHPSLQRNKSFSYLIRKDHPSVRRALQVPHFKRTDFVAKLNARIGGREISQGRGEHPKWRSNGGKAVPVPGHRELGRGLCRRILHELGVGMGLTEFMAENGPVPVAARRAT